VSTATTCTTGTVRVCAGRCTTYSTPSCVQYVPYLTRARRPAVQRPPPYTLPLPRPAACLPIAVLHVSFRSRPPLPFRGSGSIIVYNVQQQDPRTKEWTSWVPLSASRAIRTNPAERFYPAPSAESLETTCAAAAATAARLCTQPEGSAALSFPLSVYTYSWTLCPSETLSLLQ
jgi:hypothetical protein